MALQIAHVGRVGRALSAGTGGALLCICTSEPSMMASCLRSPLPFPTSCTFKVYDLNHFTSYDSAIASIHRQAQSHSRPLPQYYQHGSHTTKLQAFLQAEELMFYEINVYFISPSSLSC